MSDRDRGPLKLEDFKLIWDYPYWMVYHQGVHMNLDGFNYYYSSSKKAKRDVRKAVRKSRKPLRQVKANPTTLDVEASWWDRLLHRS